MAEQEKPGPIATSTTFAEDILLQQRINELTQIQLELQQKLTKTKIQTNESTIEQWQLLKEIYAIEDTIDQISQKQNKTQSQINGLTKDSLAILKQDSAERQKRIDYLRREIQLEEGFKRTSTDKYRSMVQELALLESLDKQYKEQENILLRITGNIGYQIKQMFTFNGIVDNIGAKFNEILDANKDFAAQVGQIASRTVTFGAGYSQFGIGLKELNAASITLYKSMTDFSNLNKDTQESLAASAAKLSLIGVSADITSANLNSLTKSFNLTAEQALVANEELARAAIGAGIAPSKMLAEFSSNLPRLAAYGKQAKDVFIDMEKQAKSLGMELNILNGIVGDQFDTFENSARAAGKLNAVLGGNYLNSVEMLNVTESERIILLKRSFEESGKNFDALSKYEKKAIAATLGIQDLNEASKLFSTSTNQLELDMQKRAATESEMANIEREAADIISELKASFNGLMIVLKPFVYMLKLITEGLTIVNDFTHGWLGSITILGFAIYQSYDKLINFYSALKKMSIIKDIGDWAKQAIGKLSLFSATTAATATETAVAGEVASVASIGFGELALVILAIGAGIGIAAAGMALFVYSLTNLFTSVTADQVGKMFELSGSIAALAVSVGLFIFALPGLIVLTGALILLGLALRTIPDDKTIVLSTLNETLNTAKTITEDNIKPTRDFIRVVKDYYEVQANSKDADKDALVAALREIMGTGEEEAAGGEEAVPVKLVISGTDLASALNNGNAVVSGMMTGTRFFKRFNG